MELKHYGIPGMRWGVQNGPPYPLSQQSHNKVVGGKSGSRSGNSKSTPSGKRGSSTPIETKKAPAKRKDEEARAVAKSMGMKDRKYNYYKKEYNHRTKHDTLEEFSKSVRYDPRLGFGPISSKVNNLTRILQEYDTPENFMKKYPTLESYIASRADLLRPIKEAVKYEAGFQIKKGKLMVDSLTSLLDFAVDKDPTAMTKLDKAKEDLRKERYFWRNYE